MLLSLNLQISKTLAPENMTLIKRKMILNLRFYKKKHNIFPLEVVMKEVVIKRLQKLLVLVQVLT
jgi:hypothetical protein